ncbi:DUF2000 family protein [Lysobacter brunescens]|uniref:DUF2000 family protein n=1 Tax=Lysobacter brunescens TaxID=262323 RepID=A0ABW2Y880_9GAMM
MSYANNDHKTIIVTRSGSRMSEIMNAATHLALGFSHDDSAPFRFVAYQDARGILAAISTYPVIVMTSKSNAHISRLINESHEAGIRFAAFTRSMIGASLEEQLRAVEGDESPEYIAAIIFGPSDSLRPLTKRFSLMTE